MRQAELSLLDDRQQRANRDTIVVTTDCGGDGRFGDAQRRNRCIPSGSQRSASQLRVANEDLRSQEADKPEAHLQAILATVPDAMVVIDERGDDPILQRDRGAPLRISPQARFKGAMSAC